MRQPQQNCCSCHTNSQCMACRTYCCGHRIAGCLTTKFYYEASPLSLTTKFHSRSLTTKSTRRSGRKVQHRNPAQKIFLKRFQPRSSSQKIPTRKIPTRKIPTRKFPTRKFQPEESKPEGSKSGESKSGESKQRSSQSRISNQGVPA